MLLINIKGDDEMNKKFSISVDMDVFQRLEELRGNKTQFRSGFINSLLKEKLGIPERPERIPASMKTTLMT